MDVWLHVGAGKTGTSAIQAALAQGRERLAAAGLFYPEALNPVGDAIARAGGITSGNGLALGWMLSPHHPVAAYDAAATQAWLRRALEQSEGRTILFSSEFLQQPLPAALPPVLDLLSQGGRRRVRVLHFSRHALDHAVAGHAQLVKTADAIHGRTTLEEHLATIQVPFLQQLETWARAIGRDAVTPRLYDEDRHALLRTVLACVHPPAAEVLAEPAATGLVNRSPTPTELRLLRLLNAEPDAAVLCKAFVGAVLNAPPAVPEPLSIPAPAVAAFAANNAPVLEALNRDWLLPAGRAPIQLSAGQIRIGDAPPADAAASEAAFGASFVATVRRLNAEVATLRREARQTERRLADPAAGGRATPVQQAMAAARAHAEARRFAEGLAVLADAERAGPLPEQAAALRDRLQRRLARRRGEA